MPRHGWSWLAFFLMGKVNNVFRPVAQLVEHRSPKPGVGGSIPSWPANEEEFRKNYE